MWDAAQRGQDEGVSPFVLLDAPPDRDDRLGSRAQGYRRRRLDYEPVSHDAVAREMGHGGTELVRRIYGHRARDPHRANEVAYRVDEHREKLTERLTAVLAAS